MTSDDSFYGPSQAQIEAMYLDRGMHMDEVKEVNMSWKTDDGLASLRRKLIAGWLQAGKSQREAERLATKKANRVSKLPAGEYDIPAGDTVVIVTVKEVTDEHGD